MQDYLNSDEFISDFTGGKPVAYNAVYNKYFSIIFGFCLKMVHQKDEAEDITTDTFIKLYQLHDRFKSHTNIRAFLFMTSRNACMDYFRNEKRKEAAKVTIRTKWYEEDEYVRINDELDELYYEVLKSAIQKLPRRQKEVIEKLYLEEIDHKTTASQMDIKIDALYVLRSRAVSLLREIMHSQTMVQGTLTLLLLHYWIHS
jgi:RNA polymerase sigma-70 factor (ECF subfamily)